jgi:hypothetical protein
MDVHCQGEDTIRWTLKIGSHLFDLPTKPSISDFVIKNTRGEICGVWGNIQALGFIQKKFYALLLLSRIYGPMLGV